jgi:hypothetical protein
MKLLDRIALNRLISIMTNFILGLLKIFAPKSIDDIEIPKPIPNRPRPLKNIIDLIPVPWRTKNE